MTCLNVVSAPLFDPASARELVQVPLGLTISEIVARVAPGQQPTAGHLRVTLSNENGTCVVEERLWHTVRPKPGATVVVRGIPGKDVLKSVLLIVVSVAATVYAPGLATSIFGAGVGKVGVAVVTAGLSIVGSLLVNALIPMETPDAQERSNVYRIDGWRNDIRPGAPVPCILGKHRYAPPFAAQSYTEIVGNEQYVRALFCAGYGPLRISDMRIGETPVDDFEDIDIEIREGYADDLPIGLFPEQVLEEGAGVQLVRPLPRDLTGEIIEGGPSIETPVTRFTASNSARASVILAFQAGLFRIDDKGRRKNQSVTVRIRARLNGVGVWSDVATLDITADQQESFFRQHTWSLPERGRWQIEVTRISEDSEETQVSDNVSLSAIQSIRPEYPINIDKPLALIAVRVRATYQLNGGLDAFNALFERRGLLHVDGTWSEGFGRNPATSFLTALMGPQNPYPVGLSDNDMDVIADWYDWCEEKGLKYDRVHDAPEALEDMLAAICGAGRASPRHDGVRWGVVIDRPETRVIDHINPRNSEQFDWSRGYFVPPDAFRVRFIDETNDYEEAERLVPWPGHEGPIGLTESIDLPGKTDPAEIYIEARRRMYELIHRPDSFSAIQSGTARVVTRGDLVMGSFDVLTQTQTSARVTSVRGRLVEIDELVSVPEGYGVRYRVWQDSEDVIGASVVRGIAPSTEETTALVLIDANDMPETGDTVHIGPIETESLALRVRGVEAGDDFSSRLIMIAAAPEIDALIDAEVAPAWDGRVGAEIDVAAVVPAVPLFLSIKTGEIGTDNPHGLNVIVGPGQGSTAQVTSFEIDHRISGTGPWTNVVIPAAASGAAIDAYLSGDSVDLRARALASSTPSSHTGIASVIIGEGDPAIPAALSDEAIVIIGALGHATIGVSVPAQGAPDALQIYRVPAGNALDRDTHAIGSPLAVSSGSTVSYADGDATRTALIDGSFAAAQGWALGDGWSEAGGIGTHAPGLAGGLSQDMSLEVGKTYRIALTVQGYVAGGFTPRLTGGTDANGVSVSADGLVLDRLTAQTGNTTFVLDAASAFEGAVTALSVFLETPSCVDAGEWDYWIEPLNSENIAGPISGPFTTTIY